jgi:predicted nuclease with TOPRIM domain
VSTTTSEHPVDIETRLHNVEAAQQDREEILGGFLVDMRDFRLETKARFDAMDKRFDAMDKRFDAMESRFNAVDGDIHKLRGDIAKLDMLTHGNERRLSAIEGVLMKIAHKLDVFG